MAVGELAGRLDRLTVSVSSPDRRIQARVRDRGARIDVEFARQAFHDYDERALGLQLGQLYRLATDAFRREYARTVDAALDDPVEGDNRDYQERMARATAMGVSRDGEVTLATRGLVEWSATVAPGVIRRLTTEQFVAALDVALAGLLTDFQQRVLEIYRAGADHARSR